MKRSMGIPSKKDKAAAKESAEAEAKPRGAVAFASVLPPRKNPERRSDENAPTMHTTTTTTPEATKNKSARDLWAAAGAAAGVTDAAVASASKRRSPLLMAYKKMKRIAGIPSKKDKEAAKAEKAEKEARENFPATPKTLPELAAADPMRQSPPGRSAAVPETRYQSALAQIIGPPIGGHKERGPSPSGGGRRERRERRRRRRRRRRAGVGTRRSASAPVVARASERVRERDVGPRAGG